MAAVMIEIVLEIVGKEIRVSAFGSRSQRPTPHSLGPEITLERLEAFAKNVGGAIQNSYELSAYFARRF